MKARYVVVLIALSILVTSAGPVTGAILDKLECNGCVDSADLAKGAVTTGKIRNGAVHTPDLAKRSVTGKRIKNRAVTLDKLAIGVLMAAKVNGSDGVLLAGTAGVTSKRISAGIYEVTFPVDVVSCAFTATHTPPIAEFEGIPFEVGVIPSLPSSKVATVAVWDDGITFYTDADFSMTAVCP